MYRIWREIATNSRPARAAEAPAVARKKSCHGSCWYGSIAGLIVRPRRDSPPIRHVTPGVERASRRLQSRYVVVCLPNGSFGGVTCDTAIARDLSEFSAQKHYGPESLGDYLQ